MLQGLETFTTAIARNSKFKIPRAYPRSTNGIPASPTRTSIARPSCRESSKLERCSSLLANLAENLARLQKTHSKALAGNCKVSNIMNHLWIFDVLWYLLIILYYLFVFLQASQKKESIQQGYLLNGTHPATSAAVGPRRSRSGA